MAANGGRINFQVGMTVEKNGLNQIIKSLQQVQNEAKNIKVNDEGFQKASKAAKQLESIINSSWNDKLNQLNLDKFNQSVKNSYGSVAELKNHLSGAGASGQAAFNSLASSVLNTNLQLRQSNQLLNSMATSMANTVKWGITSSIFNNITSSVQKAYYYAKDLDTSLNDIRIVTGDSADQMQRFSKNANDAAKELGRSTLDYTKAALSFYQQGLSDEEVQARTNVTLKAQNITGAGSEMADQLTAVWNGFKVSAEDTQGIVDKLAKVADSSASNMSQLAIAMSKVAATANVVGVDVDQLTAQLATVIATTRQAPQAVGTAFKTIYSRLNDIKTGADDAQISLGNYSGKMAQLGFDVLDANGQLRDTGQVIEQIGSRWDTLTKAQQIYLAQTMGGMRQVTQVTALFDNWTKYSEMLNTSLSAQGTLNEKNDIYLESTAAHLEKLGAEAERTYATLFDMDTINGFVDAMNGVLKVFNDFIGGIGGGVNAFVSFGAVIANIFNVQIGNAIANQIKNFEAYKNNLAQIQAQKDWSQAAMDQTVVAHAGSNDTVSQAALEKEAAITQRTLEVRKALTQEQYNQLQGLQQQVGVAQTQIDNLEKYKTISLQILDTENASIQEYQQRLSIEQQTLQEEQQLANEVARAVVLYRQYTDNEEEALNLAVAIEQASNSQLLSEEQKIRLAELQIKLEDGKELSQQEIKEIIEMQNVAISRQKDLVNQINLGLQGRKAAENGTLNNLKEEQAARERIIQQQQQQAAKQLAIQQAVRISSGLIQGISTGLGGLKTALDQTATTTEKINGAWSGITGVISGVAMAINPLFGMMVTGISGIIKSSLQLVGVWDWIEDRFKSTQEKIQELQESLSKTKDVSINFKTNKENIQNIKDQFQTLSKKAGQYGQNLSSMSEEQQARYHELVQTIIDKNPELIAGYNAQGQAIIANNDAIQDTLNYLDKQYQKQMAILYAKDKIANAEDILKEKNQIVNEATSNSYITNPARKAAQERANARNDAKQASRDLLADKVQIGTSIIEGYQIPEVEKSPFKKLSQALKNYSEHKQLQADLENYVNDYKEIINKTDVKTEEVTAARETLYNNLSKLLTNVNNIQSQLPEGISDATITNVKEYLELFMESVKDIDITLTESESKINQAVAKANSEAEDAQNELNNALTSYKNYLFGALRYDPSYGSQFDYIRNSWADNFTPQIQSLLESIMQDWVNTTIDNNYIDYLQEEDMTGALVRDFNNFIRESFEKINPEDLQTVSSQISDLMAKSEELSAKQFEDQFKKIFAEFISSDSLTKIAQQDLAQHGNLDLTNILLQGIFGDSVQIYQNAEGKIKGVYETTFKKLTDSIGGSGQAMARKFLQQAGYSEAQLQALANQIQQQGLYFNDWSNFVHYAKTFLSSAGEDIEQGGSRLAEGFDKVNKAIAKLQSGKELSYKDKLNLMEYLGLTDQQVQDTETVLNKFKEQIKGLTGLERYEGLSKIFTDFDTLRQYKDDFNVTEQQEKALWQDIFENELNALQIDQEALQNWATNRGMVFTELEDKEKALNSYTIEKDAESLQKLAQTVKNAGDQVDTSSDEFIQLQTQLEQLTGEPWSPDRVISMLDAIAAYADDGIHKFENYKELIDYFNDYTPQKKSKTPLEHYQEDKTSLNNLSGASQALSNKSQMSQEQSEALAKLLLTNSQLNQIAAEQGINSQEFLDKLNEAINSQRILNEQKREQLRLESEQNLKKLQNQKSNLQLQLLSKRQIKDLEHIAGSNDRQEAEKAQAILEHQKQLKDDIKNINGQILEEQKNLINLSQQDLETIKNKYNTLKQLQEGLINQQISENQYQALRPDILQAEIKALGRTKEEFEDFVDVLKQNSKSLAQNQQQAEDMAIVQWEMQKALDDLIKNFDDYAEAINNAKNLTEDAKMADTDYVNAISSLRTAMQELLGVDLSNKFLSDTNNLELMKAAIEGDIEALQQLRINAAQDFIVGLDLQPSALSNIQSLVSNFVNTTDFDDLQVGAALNDENFIAGLNGLIANGQMTAQQVNAILNTIGYEADIGTDHATIPVSVPSIDWSNQIDTITSGSGLNGAPTSVAAAMRQQMSLSMQTVSADFTVPYIKGGNYKGNRPAANRAVSHPSSGSGGKKGGGGGGKPKKGGGGGKSKKDNAKQAKTQEALDDKQDRYHDINIQIKHINNQLEKLQQQEDKLSGKKLINNLNEQLKILNKQIDAYEIKLELQKQERDELKKSLSKQGVKFDTDGDISNYSTALSAKLKYVNDIIAKYNAMSADQQQNYKATVDKAKQDYEQFKEDIARYDELISEQMPDMEKAIRDLQNQKIEKQIQKFKISVDLELDTSKAERDFNAFTKKVIKQIRKDDVLGNALSSFTDLSSYYKPGNDVIDSLTNQVNDTLFQLQQMDKTGTSSVYGDNRTAALEDLKDYTDKLMSNLLDIEDLVNEIKESIFDAIDAAQKAFDDQVDQYEYISDLIDHNVELVKLLYGDDAYEDMDKYYKLQQKNNNKQLDFLKQQKEFWYSRMIEQQQNMNNLDAGSNAFKQAEERFEEYKKHWMDTTNDLNKKLEDSLQNIIDKYVNAIDLVFDKLNDKLTSGKGLDNIKEEWELINKQADMYLDKVNSMYQIDKLEKAYQDAIEDNSGNLSAQKSLNNMMKEQLAYLRDKDKLTQYDVDRANALLQIEIKRLALQQQRQSKTKLRLRRDSQGNYTYQYTVDEDGLKDAKQELQDAEVSLYNMTKEAYKNNLDSYYDTVTDWQNKVKDVYEDTTLTAEQQQQKVLMLNQYYGEMINGLTEQNENLKRFMMQDTFNELSKMYDVNVDNYKNMTDTEKDLLMGDLVPYWKSGIQEMQTVFAAQGGFLPTVQQSFEQVAGATKDYQNSLKQLQTSAGVSFKNIANGIDPDIQKTKELLADNEELISAYEKEISSINEVIKKVKEMTKTYNTAKDAAIAAAQASYKYTQQQNKTTGDESKKKVKTATQTPKTQAPKATSTVTTTTKVEEKLDYETLRNYQIKLQTGKISLDKIPEKARRILMAAGGLSMNGFIDPGRVQMIKRAMGYETGGYTGSWGKEGKLAILHDKELVLNRTDTSNILQAVQIVKTMEGLLNGIRADTGSTSINNYNSSSIEKMLDQHVHIEAHFPNVSEHSEIEQALKNLVNRASQFAFKN